MLSLKPLSCRLRHKDTDDDNNNKNSNALLKAALDAFAPFQANSTGWCRNTNEFVISGHRSLCSGGFSIYFVVAAVQTKATYQR